MQQESHLWTSTGLLVGTFGATAWELQLKTTWKMKPNDGSNAAQEMNKVIQNAVPPPPHRSEETPRLASPRLAVPHPPLSVQRNPSRCPATTGFRDWPRPHGQSLKTIISELFAFSSTWRSAPSPTASPLFSHSSLSLSKKLAAKQAKPQVSVTAIHDEVFSESSVSALHNLILSLCCLTISQHRHPVVDINKRGYLSKKLKAAMAQGSHLVSLNASHPHPHSNSHDLKR
jgi:hypothetical protein